jgi:hypothetical protein
VDAILNDAALSVTLAYVEQFQSAGDCPFNDIAELMW